MRMRLRDLSWVTIAFGAVWAAVAGPVDRPGVVKDAEVVSVDGAGWVRFASTPDWHDAERAQVLTAGDGLRTGDFGRLGVLFVDGVQIKISRRTTLVVKQVARPGPGAGHATTIGLERGEIWSRAKITPGSVQVETPSATAAIRGTDWDIVVDEKGTSYLTVLRGTVEFFNPAGSLLVERGQQAMAEVGHAPVRTFLVQPAERVQWVFSFPLDVSAAVPFRFHNRRLAMDALDAARHRVARAPGDNAARLDLAGILYDLRENKESAVLAGEVLNADPTNARALILSGLLALRTGDPARADSLFGRALAVGGGAGDIDALLGRIGAWVALGRIGEASAVVEDLASRPGLPAVVGVVIAHFRAYTGEFKQAAETAGAFAVRFPDDERFPTLVAAMRMVLDDNTAAEDAARQALALTPDYSPALAVLGEIHHLEGRGDEAEAAYRAALAADPGNVLASNGLSLVLAERGQFREAAAFLDRALAQAPEASILWANRGYLRTLVEDLGGASSDYREALTRDPGQHLALSGEALVAIKQGRPADALDDALRAGLLEPSLSRPHALAAIASYQQGLTDRALQELDLASQLDPRDPFPHLVSYLIFQDTYRPYEAVQSAQKVLERLPFLKSIDALENTQQGLSSLGSALLGFGLPEWAESYAQESYNPHSAASHFQASRRYNTNRNATVSELVQGLLLDPLAHSQPNRRQDIIRRPRTGLTLGGSWGEQAGGFSQRYNAIWQGYQRLPWEVSWGLQVQGSDTGGDGINDDSRGGSIAFGLGVRPSIDQSFSFAFDWSRETNGAPGDPLAPDPDDKLEFSNFSFDLGYRRRLGPRNDLLVRAALENSANELTNPAPFGTGLTDLQASFILAGWSVDATRGFFSEGLYEITSIVGPPGDSYATDSTGTIAAIPGAIRLPATFPALVDTDLLHRDKNTDRTRLLQLRHLFAIGKNHEFTYGAEYIPVRSRAERRATVYTPVDTVFFYEEPILDPEGSPWTFSAVAPTVETDSSETKARFLTVYADDRWQASRWLLVEGGLFFESFRDDTNSDNRLFPRLGVAVEVAPGHVLRAGGQRWLDKVSRGTLAPISTAGLVLDNTRALQGSTLRDYQVRLESRWRPWLFTAAGVERIELTDAPRPGFFARDNRLDRWSVAANAILGREFAGFARYVHSEAEETGGALIGRDVPGVPGEAGSVGVVWISPRYFRVVVSHNRIGSQALSYTSTARIPAYWSTDLSAAWEPMDKRLQVALSVGNLFNNAAPAPGRSVFLSVEGRF